MKLSKVLDFFGLSAAEKEVSQPSKNKKVAGNNSKVISMNRKSRKNKKQSSTFNLYFYYPESYDQVKNMVDVLKDNKPIILNLDKVEKNEAKRFIDFISGAVYSLEGEIRKVGRGVFLFTPQNVKIDGEEINDALENNIFSS